MSHTKRADEAKLAQAYFYGLLQNQLTSPPAGLDPQTAEIIRGLVASEQRASSTAPSQVVAVQQRVWQQLTAEAQSYGSLGEAGKIANESAYSKLMTNLEETRKPGGQKLRNWGRLTVVGGMAATIVLMLGLIALVVINTHLGEIQATQSPAIQPASTVMPTAKSTIIIKKPTVSGLHNYKITLQVTTQNPDPKQFKSTLSIVEQRIKALGANLISIAGQDNKLINLEVGGVTDEKQLTQVISEPGRVEFIVLNGEQLNYGDAVQTTYCTTGSLTQPAQTAAASCDQNGSKDGKLNSLGQPFQTIVSNDSTDMTKLSQSNGGESSIITNLLNKLRGANNQNNPKMNIAVVLDNKIMLTSDQVNTLLNNDKSGKVDLVLLTTLLKSGILPLDLVVVSSNQL